MRELTITEINFIQGGNGRLLQQMAIEGTVGLVGVILFGEFIVANWTLCAYIIGASAFFVYAAILGVVQ